MTGTLISELGIALVEGSLLLAAVSLGLTLLKQLRFGRVILISSCLFVISTEAVFSTAFLTNDFSMTAVYEGSSRGLDTFLKLAASWSGSSGSLLFLDCAIAVMVLAVMIAERNPRKMISRIELSFFGLLLLALTLPVLLVGPFASSPAPLVDGRGLDPSLQTIMSLLHPPLIFGAYASIMYAYAKVLVLKGTGGTTWRSVRLGVSAAWVLLTAGIGLGGYWAYSTLGWGGYWSWDPIETSALIPWLFLTALLFFPPHSPEGGAGLLAVSLSTSSVLFTMYVARGANLPSVHSYGLLNEGGYLIALAVAPLIPAAYLALSKMNANKGIRGLSLWKEGALLFWIVVGLGVVEVTTLIGILGGMNELGVSRVQLFDYVTFPFLLLFTVVLSMSTMRKAFGQKQMTYLMPLAFVIVASLLSGGKLGDIALALAVLMMISAIIVGLQRGLMPGQMAWSIGKFSMLAGVSIILVGVVISSTMVSSQSVILSQNQSISVSGISVDMTGATLSAGQTSVFLPYYGIMPESVNLNVGLQVGTPSKTSSLELRYYPSKDQFYSQPLIVGNWLYDVYITASPTGEIVNATSALLTNHASLSVTSVAMVVEVIQGVSLIWIGLVMTVVGGSLFLIKTGGNRSDSSADSN